jgi:uncharacterized phage protein gp47/JayE
MAFSTPKYQDLYNQAIADIKSRLGLSGTLGKIFLQPLAAVISGLIRLVSSNLAQVNRNILPDEADNNALLRHGKLKLGRVLNPEIYGQYRLNITGEIGGTVTADSTYSNGRGGVFVVDTAVTLSASSGQIIVRSLTSGATITAEDAPYPTAPIANVNKYASLDAEIVPPAAAETMQEYKQAVIDAYIAQGQGGNASDYRTWAAYIAGIRTVYAFAAINSAGDVMLMVEANAADSVDGYGTPSAGQLSAVQDAIEPTRENLGVHEIFYVAPRLLSVDLVFYGLLDYGVIGSVRNAVTAKLVNIRPYIAGADRATDYAKGKLRLSDITAAADSVGAVYDDVKLFVGGAQVTAYEFTYIYIPAMGNITAV